MSVDSLNVENYDELLEKLSELFENAHSEEIVDSESSFKCPNRKCNGDLDSIMLLDGDTVCILCNTVVDRYIDHTAEWRNYQDTAVNQTRCGMPMNEMYPNSNLGSLIAYDSCSGFSRKLRKYHMWNSMPYKERNLYNIADYITNKAKNGDITPDIINDANNLYKNISTSKISRGDNKSGLIASCMYHACKTNNVPRSAREVAKMFGIPVSVMTKGCKKFNELMKISSNSTSPHHFIDRFCSKLNCDDIKDICMYAVNKIAEHSFVSENAPSSIAAACIYMVSHFAKRKTSKKTIAQMCDISEVTINKCYNKLFEYRGIILPETFIWEFNVQ